MHEGGTRPKLEDLQAAHGTFVDGARLKPGAVLELHEGSLLQFGESSRRYLVKGVRHLSGRWEGEADL